MLMFLGLLWVYDCVCDVFVRIFWMIGWLVGEEIEVGFVYIGIILDFFLMVYGLGF